MVAQRLHRFIGQANIGTINLRCLIAGINLHPLDFPLTGVGFAHRSVHHLEHDGRHIRTDAIAFDVRDDRLTGHIQCVVRIDGDFLAR